ncbi:MAG: 3-hydroxybutyryl-CoA dehydrogenase [Chloroflexi bacterium 13_1_40CM_4_68_4]|nr:MAG: 3-hydroxybutyryl-CoA dehydrogenase [Chloroflexi bacterium 13_1_40CM_4_68_4]
MAIQRVGVVGFGLMGHGIAQVAAQAGYQVIVRETEQRFIDAGFKRVDVSLERLVKAGRVAEAEAKTARGRIQTTTEVKGLRDCQLVIEAITEDLQLKKSLYQELDAVCPPGTIFASNTSSMTIAELAAATKRPDRFAGLHFFNPVQVMKLVEIVRAITTSDETIATLREFTSKIGKTGVVCKDTPGFIVNRLLIPYLNAAIRALEEGVATPEEIDEAVKLGLGYPMGPFTLLDYVGLDTQYHASNVLYDEFKQPDQAPPPLLKRMVLAGHYGRKSGRGFYRYDETGERKK